MSVYARLLSALSGLLLVLAFAQSPAMAESQSGTHAWSTDSLTLRDGPGTVYNVTGQLDADLAIMVLRCQKLWCLVDGDTGRGWTDRGSISFGKTSADWPGGVNPDYRSGGPVCFYTGTNYTGSEFCVRGGRTIQDLALLGLDNSFSSVRINGTASVAACRDRFFQSYCERIIVSQPALDPYLRRNLSSIRLY